MIHIILTLDSYMLGPILNLIDLPLSVNLFVTVSKLLLQFLMDQTK